MDRVADTTEKKRIRTYLLSWALLPGLRHTRTPCRVAVPIIGRPIVCCSFLLFERVLRIEHFVVDFKMILVINIDKIHKSITCFYIDKYFKFVTMVAGGGLLVLLFMFMVPSNALHIRKGPLHIYGDLSFGQSCISSECFKSTVLVYHCMKWYFGWWSLRYLWEMSYSFCVRLLISVRMNSNILCKSFFRCFRSSVTFTSSTCDVAN